MTLKELALSYAKRGWAVFPLVEGGKTPLTAHGVKDATKDEKQIEFWWDKRPNANIGIATGAISGFDVVDIDVKNGAKGMENLEKLKLTPTVTVKTPSGGYHFYFKHTPGLRNRTNLLPGIDFKTDGGYVVGVGSSLSGKFYEDK